MSLADDIAKNGAPPHRPFRADVVLAELEDDDRKDLLDALNDTAVYAASISRALQQRGVTLSENAVRSWRRAQGIAL